MGCKLVGTKSASAGNDDSDLVVGTQNVAVYLCKYRPDINVYLIDTPGFDDTHRSDTEVLKEIAAWLTASYSSSIKLHGIIYLHRITDDRMQGSAKRNLMMFKKLCGASALKNVILATTMWERVPESLGAARERELEDTAEFWGWMKERGSQILRHQNDRASAMQLIQVLTSKPPAEARVVLDIQQQMVNQGMQLDETAAGQELEGLIERERKRFEKELAETQSEMREALESRDKETAQLLFEEQDRVEAKVQQLNKEQSELKVSLERLYEERSKKMKEELGHAKRENEATRKALLAAQQEQSLQRSRFEEEKLTRQKADEKHLADMAALQKRMEQLANNPRVRSHAGENKMSKWTVSLSLFDSYYWWVGPTDFFKAPPGFPEERKRNGNGNRYVALGDKGSFYIHYHEGGKCWTQRSGSLKDVYPGLHKYLTDKEQYGCPTCVSLGTDGSYFIRTKWGCSHALSERTKKHLNEKGGMASVVSLWLGKDEAYVAAHDSTTKSDLSWNLRGYYPGLMEKLRMADTTKDTIAALAMNPTNTNQWLILRKNGRASYQGENTGTYDGFTYEEWCTRNFGTTWGGSAQIDGSSA